MQQELKVQQGELMERVSARCAVLPRVRPTADADLAEDFLRAAVAWARWREKQKWAGR